MDPGVAMSVAGPDTFTQETYLPETGGSDLARVFDFLAAHELVHGERPAPRYLLAGPDAGEQVVLPEDVYRILHHVVNALQAGLAVTVAPTTTTLTTQQAADLLGVSRPTIVKYLDAGQIPHTKAGSHRRVLLSDVLAFRAAQKVRQYDAIAATSADPDAVEDLDAVADSLRRARKAVAERRRTRRASGNSAR
jgi:excisionase family DNA binding protein